MFQSIIDDVIGTARVRVAQRVSTAEAELTQVGDEILRRFHGRVTLALAAAAGVGIVIGAILF